MNLQDIGMQSRIRYEVRIFWMIRGCDDLKDWEYKDGYSQAVKRAKEISRKEGITHVDVVKVKEYFSSKDPDVTQDQDLVWWEEYRNGKRDGERMGW